MSIADELKEELRHIYETIGAVLDRNGLRPGRYYVTTDDLVIMASEAGVLTIPPEKVVAKGRLEPGKMFMVDTVAGRIVSDAEIKHEIIFIRFIGTHQDYDAVDVETI
jgi:hypothetical protein